MFNHLKNLFIVKTPLQIINTIEAINHFNLTNNILIIVSDKNNKNSKQMKNLIQLYSWDDVIIIDAKMSYFKDIDTIKKLKEHEYDYIFFARFGSIQRLIISNTKKNNLYYFDDGMETTTMYNKLLVTNKINKFDSRQFARIRFILAGLRINIKDTINLFTYFDLKPFGESKVILNKLDYFRNNYLKSDIVDHNIYLLGQPLFEKNIIKEKIYIDSLKNVIDNTDKNIIYILHKGEDINSKVKSLENNKFTILNIDIPIELYFLENKIEPQHIISFFTTAFFTLKMFYPKATFESIYLSEEYILKKQYEIQLHYDFINSIGVTYHKRTKS